MLSEQTTTSQANLGVPIRLSSLLIYKSKSKKFTKLSKLTVLTL
jgi:hypothetical protein